MVSRGLGGFSYHGKGFTQNRYIEITTPLTMVNPSKYQKVDIVTQNLIKTLSQKLIDTSNQKKEIYDSSKMWWLVVDGP